MFDLLPAHEAAEVAGALGTVNRGEDVVSY